MSPLVGEERVRTRTGAEEIPIGLIDDECSSRLPCGCENVLKDVALIDRTSGVVWRDENDGPSPRAHPAAGISRVRYAAAVWTKPRRHGVHTQHARRHLVTEVPWHGQHDLIPLPRQGQHRVEEPLVAPGGDHDTVDTDIPAIDSVDVSCQPLSQGRHAEDVGVACCLPVARARPRARSSSVGGDDGNAWQTSISGSAASIPSTHVQVSGMGGAWTESTLVFV